MHPLHSLTTDHDRQNWVATHAPAVDRALVQQLYEEAQQQERENPHHALQTAQLVQWLATIWQDAQTQAVALHIQANAKFLLAEHQTALQLYQEAKQQYETLGQEVAAARVSVGQLATMQYLGLYDEALTLAKWAMDVFYVAGDELARGKLLMNCGNIYGRLNRFAEARQSYGEARTLFQQLAEARYLAMVNVNEAIVLTELNEFRQAEQAFLQARAYFAEQKMVSVVAQVDHNLAYLYMGQGDYQQALTTFDQARQVFVEQANEAEVANVDLLRSDIYLALNLWEEALAQLETARPVFEQAGMAWETGRTYLNQAAALVRRDPQTAPEPILEKARHIFTSEQNQVWLAVTDLYQATFAWRKQEAEQTQQYAQQALTAFQRAGLSGRAAQCALLLGEVALAEPNLPSAQAYFQFALNQLDGAELPAITYSAHYGLGRVQEQQQKFSHAQTSYQQAMYDLERLQATIGAEDYKIAFRQDKLEVYEKAVLLALQEQAQPAAFSTIERAKSRVLLDLMSQKPHPASPAEAGLWQEIQRLKQELSWYYSRLNQPTVATPLSAQESQTLTEAITRRERALAQQMSRWQTPDLAPATRNPVWTVTADQLQAVLPEQTLLLQFFTAGEEIWLFGLTAADLWSQKLPVTVSQITHWLTQFRFQLNKFSYGPAYRQRHQQAWQKSTDQLLHHLFEGLLAPLGSGLEQWPHLLIVPHGVLHYVPFQALFDGQNYLIAHKTVAYAPSATILYRTLTSGRANSTTRPLIMGLADPTIPHAQSEAQAVAELFPNAQLCVGSEATTHHLTQASTSPAFLHLSTHALFRADNPAFSALQFADGWLTVQDIYQLDQVIPLVTLSACETGRHQVAVGDELVGLCRGFFAAGTQSLLVSLWMVDDQATAALMRLFYQELQSGRPVHQALRTAQLAILAQHPHPYFWAAFVLSGNPLLTIQ